MLDRVPLLAEVRDELPHLRQRADHPVVPGGGQAPAAQQVVGVRLVVDVEADPGADAVHHHPQRAGGGDQRVLLAQRAGRGVPRVHEQPDHCPGPLALLGALLVLQPAALVLLREGGVERLEGLGREVDLAADLDQLGHVLAGEPVRDLLDGADVGGDVLADPAVAPGRRLRQPAVLVGEVDGQAVHLQLAQVVVLDPGQLAGDPLGPGGELLVVHRVVQAEQPLPVLDRGEQQGRRAADPLRGRLRGDQGGVLRLQPLQLAHQRVELGVADDRRVLLVVAGPVVRDLGGQLGVPLAHLRRNVLPALDSHHRKPSVNLSFRVVHQAPGRVHTE